MTRSVTFYDFSLLVNSYKGLIATYERNPDMTNHELHAPLGEERYKKYRSKVTKRHLIQYDYRHIDGELFSTVRRTLEECRLEKDVWLEKKGGAV